MIAVIVFCAVLWIAIGFDLSKRRRLQAECDSSGHVWEPAGMGDHPDVSCVCARCGLEF